MTRLLVVPVRDLSMSSRTLVNLFAVVLFVVAATLIGAGVMKSGAPPGEVEEETRRNARVAEAAPDDRQGAARPAAMPAADTTKQWFPPPDAKNEEVAKRVYEKESEK